MKEIFHTINNCPACHQKHIGLSFASIEGIVEGVSFSAVCPLTDKILLRNNIGGIELAFNFEKEEVPV